MISPSNDFQHLVNRAVSDSKLSHMRNAIEKELLIYNILFCLDQLDKLDNIVFQGGTLLRFGHGGQRLSEDLDFVAGTQFSPADFGPVKSGIENYFLDRYGLSVDVKEPKSDSTRGEKSDKVTVYRWLITAALNPDRPDVPRQRIKIEVANVPAHTKEIVAVRKHYDVLPDGYDDILVISETLTEVMADKLISLLATERNIRYRDIWDLYWLIRRQTEVDFNLVKRKVIDYRLIAYKEALKAALEQLPNIVNSLKFRNEMHQLLPVDVYDHTLRKPKFTMHLLSCVKELFEQVLQSLE